MSQQAAAFYRSQSARDARAAGYGEESYWNYLDQSAIESYRYFMDRNDPAMAEHMLNRSLSEALMGNNGD